jgi:hypothetical protein
MEDKSIIIGAVAILAIVLFVLMLIPGSKSDILGQMGSDAVKFGSNTGGSPSQAPAPTITELSAQRVRVGSGSAQVKAGDVVVVHYKGAFTDGKVFDDSYQRNEPFKVQIGAKQVIPGFEQGVLGMLIGEIRRIFIPANLAYGAQGQGSIPPNTPLIFEIELLNIEAAATPTPEAPSEAPSEAPAESPTPTSQP